SLFHLDWIPVALPVVGPQAPWAVVGDHPSDLAAGLEGSGLSVVAHLGVEELVGTEDLVPEVLALVVPGVGAVLGDAGKAAVKSCLHTVLAQVQSFLAEDHLALTKMVVLTQGAVATGGGDDD